MKYIKTRRRTIHTGALLVALLCLLVNLMPVTALAISEEDQKALDIGAVWHVLDEKDDVLCSGGTIVLPGTDNEVKVWNFMIGKGLKPWMAAGFMGNMVEEAHFEPRLVEYGYPNSRGEISKAGKPSSLDDAVPPNVNSAGQPGYGIIQWTSPGRKDGLRNKSSSTGIKPGDLGLQLEYMWDELNGPYKKSTLDPLLASSTVEDATKTITYHYEIPAKKEERVITRTQKARGYLAKYGSQQATPAPDPNAPVTTAPAASGCGPDSGDPNQAPGAKAANIASTAVLYSWPSSNGLTPKPEYAAAVAQFNKGVSNNGADCGAFVATVMLATGADPNYPKVGTAVQMQYVKAHPDLYMVTNNFGLQDLRPGDILIVGSGGGSQYGHTYIFVGDQGGGKNKADASIGSRMPNLGKAEVNDSSGRGHYTLARLK